MVFKTTPQFFGDKLHTYTIVDAINDNNVLPFRIDYVNTIKEKDNVRDEQVKAIDIEKAMASSQRIHNVVEYILEHFNQKLNVMTDIINLVNYKTFKMLQVQRLGVLLKKLSKR